MKVFPLVLSLLLAVRALAAEEAPPLFIEGYPAQYSVAPGDQLAFHVSTSAPTFGVEISRVGAETRSVWTGKALPGQAHPIPEDASSMGCHWPESFRVPVGKEWKTGYYSVRLHVEDRGGKYVQRGKRTAESESFFIVRAAQPGQQSKVLLQLCTNTYNAYTNWGGFSVYAYHGLGKNQGSRASFERPQSSQFSRWEQPFVQWCERNGYALEYATNADLEFRPELLKSYRLVLSVGHDEYWSGPMRDTLEGFVAGGGNVAFFSGNSVCWQIRTEDEGRAFTCFKQHYFVDPIYQTRDFKTLSTLWSHHLVARPENQLTGVGFLWGGYMKSHGQFMDAKAAYVVHRPEHWVFAGTSLKQGDDFGGKDTIVGYETDGCELEWRDGLPYPTHRDGTPETFTVLASCPVSWHPDDCEWYEKWEKGRIGRATMGIYTKGGTVFTAATTDWAHGLAGADPAVDRITRNILDRLSK